MDQKRVTVKDIAAKLGVSLGIINKALNDKGGISDEMRERILTTAREMGYRVNKVAQSMARNTIVLGVLVPAQEKDYFSFLKKGLDKEFERLADYNVQCRYYPIENTYSAADTIETLKACMNDKVHGILLCEYFPSELEKIFEELEAQKIPTVLIGDTESAGNRYLSSIQVDAYRSGQMAAEMLHLCAKKNASVSIFVGNKDHVEHMQKIRGFTESLKEYGLHPIGVYETYDDEEIALQLFRKISGRLDGLYVATSTFASIGKVLQNEHPDLKVICTDVDGAVAACLKAGAVQASLFQDLEKQGSTAVRVLYEYIAEKKTPEKTICITPRLVIESNLDTFI
ncbi:MAG: LacI family DNA-binding transcriptional regulator [Clostridia bacterium]|nr:LacI family DNA-binding transcriptional regulator [Clostridia bacterium]